eukprot:5935294-Pyramimonas_sp.AAC.1
MQKTYITYDKYADRIRSYAAIFQCVTILKTERTWQSRYLLVILHSGVCPPPHRCLLCARLAGLSESTRPAECGVACRSGCVVT